MRSRPVRRFDLEQAIAVHSLLLEDRRRNRAFAAALADRVGRGSRVLDVGAGSGLWAVLAARLGAREVVAVERKPVLVPIIEALARENGVADRVRVVPGDSRRLDLPRRFDLVVSETVGNLGLEEGILEILSDARRRFLRPGGHLMPQGLAFRAAPACRSRRNATPISRGAFDALAVHFPGPATPPRLLARARELGYVDFRAPSAPLGLSARWRVARASRVGGVAVWLRLDLAPGRRLETLSGTHWSPTLYGVDGLPPEAGHLEFRLRPGERDALWEVSFSGPGGSIERRYGPLFAWGWLAPRLSPASHRRR